jgi:hypothetical protein
VSQRARTRPRPEAAEVGMPSERQVLFWLALLAFGYVFGFVGLLVRCNDPRASAQRYSESALYTGGSG